MSRAACAACCVWERAQREESHPVEVAGVLEGPHKLGKHGVSRQLANTQHLSDAHPSHREETGQRDGLGVAVDRMAGILWRCWHTAVQIDGSRTRARAHANARCAHRQTRRGKRASTVTASRARFLRIVMEGMAGPTTLDFAILHRHPRSCWGTAAPMACRQRTRRW